MRCPKCDYISFDYNKVCPKCSKDITAEQAKLNLPSFRPNPPSLLGALTGEANESNIGINADSSGIMNTSGMDLGFDDSTSMDSEDMSYDDSHGMEISLDADDSGEFEITDALSISDDEELPEIDFGGGDEEISLDSGAIETIDTDEAAEEIIEPEIELESFTTDVDESPKDPMQTSMQLNLDDLKINETGELEIGDMSLEKPDIGEAEESLDLEGISLDEPEIASEDTVISDDMTLDESVELDLGDFDIDTAQGPASEETVVIDDLSLDDSGELDLGDFALDEPEGAETEETMVVDDLSLDDLPSEEADDELDLDGISFEDAESASEETILVADKLKEEDVAEAVTGELNLNDLTIDEPDSEEDVLSLDEVTDLQHLDVDDDEMTLDLENLDIDLDFDEPEDKS